MWFCVNFFNNVLVIITVWNLLKHFFKTYAMLMYAFLDLIRIVEITLVKILMAKINSMILSYLFCLLYFYYVIQILLVAVFILFFLLSFLYFSSNPTTTPLIFINLYPLKVCAMLFSKFSPKTLWVTFQTRLPDLLNVPGVYFHLNPVSRNSCRKHLKVIFSFLLSFQLSIDQN